VQCVHVVASHTAAAVSVCTLLCDAVDAACVLAEVAYQLEKLCVYTKMRSCLHRTHCIHAAAVATLGLHEHACKSNLAAAKEHL
jgi:hypothetical protein